MLFRRRVKRRRGCTVLVRANVASHRLGRRAALGRRLRALRASRRRRRSHLYRASPSVERFTNHTSRITNHTSRITTPRASIAPPSTDRSRRIHHASRAMTPLLEMRAEASREPRPRAPPPREDDANDATRTNETEIEDSRAPWTWWTSLPRVRKDFRRQVRRLARGRPERIRGGAGHWYIVFTRWCSGVLQYE